MLRVISLSAIILTLCNIATSSVSATFTYTCSGAISGVKLDSTRETLKVRMGSQDVEVYGNYKQSGSKQILSGQNVYFEFNVNKQVGYVEFGSKSGICRR